MMRNPKAGRTGTQKQVPVEGAEGVSASPEFEVPVVWACGQADQEPGIGELEGGFLVLHSTWG